MCPIPTTAPSRPSGTVVNYPEDLAGLRLMDPRRRVQRLTGRPSACGTGKGTRVFVSERLRFDRARADEQGCEPGSPRRSAGTPSHEGLGANWLRTRPPRAGTEHHERPGNATTLEARAVATLDRACRTSDNPTTVRTTTECASPGRLVGPDDRHVGPRYGSRRRSFVVWCRLSVRNQRRAVPSGAVTRPDPPDGEKHWLTG